MRLARHGSNTRVAATIGVLVSFSLAGCGTPTGPENGAQNSLPGAEEFLHSPCPEVGTKPPAGQPITYWSMWTADEPQGKVLQKAMNCFTEKTGVKINVQWQGRKGYTTNLVPALNTGAVPDLFDQDVSKVSAAIAQPGGTQSVDDVFGMKIGEGEKTVKDVLMPASYDFPQNKDAQGATFLVPYELQTNAWWYNKDANPGFTPPSTMDDMIGVFEKAKSGGKSAVAQDGDIASYNMYFYTQLAERFAGSGGLHRAATDKTGQTWKTDPAFLRAAEETAKIPPHFIEGWDAAKYPQVQQRWADGEARYLFMGSWLPSEAREYLAKQGSSASINFGSFQFPKPSGATHDTIEQMSFGFAVPKNAKNPQAAKTFMAYLLNKDNLLGMTVVANNLVPRSDLPVPNDLKDVKAAVDAPNQEVVLQYDGLDALAGGTWATEVFDPLNLKLLKRAISPQEFVDSLAQRSAEFWKSRS